MEAFELFSGQLELPRREMTVALYSLETAHMVMWLHSFCGLLLFTLLSVTWSLVSLHQREHMSTFLTLRRHRCPQGGEKNRPFPGSKIRLSQIQYSNLHSLQVHGHTKWSTTLILTETMISVNIPTKVTRVPILFKSRTKRQPLLEIMNLSTHSCEGLKKEGTQTSKT